MSHDVHLFAAALGSQSSVSCHPQRPEVATADAALRICAARPRGRILLSLVASLATFTAFAQTCAPSQAATCDDQQRIVEYRHNSGVHVYLICEQDKAAVAAYPDFFTATGRNIDGTAITDPAVKRGLRRYLFAAKPGTGFFSRHFYTAISAEESSVEAISPSVFKSCKEGTAGSFAAPLLPTAEQASANPSYQLARCASGQRPLWRLFRATDRITDPIEPVQHRFTDRYVEVTRLSADGYTDEYIRACTGDDSYRLVTSITPLSTTALAAGSTARYRVTVNATEASATGMRAGTLVFAWPAGVQATVANAAACASVAQLPERIGEANTRLACVFPASSTNQQFNIDIDLTAPAGYNAVPTPLLRAAATTRVVGNNAAADGIATSEEIGACADNGIPAYPCAVLSTAAVAPPAPALLFTVKGIDVTNVASGTPQIGTTVLATQANVDYISNIYHKLSNETAWTRVGGSRPRSAAGDQLLIVPVTLAADRRGTGALRFCAGTSAPADPGNTGSGPTNPACRESAPFITPQLASTVFAVSTPVVSGASTGTVVASATVTTTASDVSYTSSAYYRAGSSGAWTLMQSQSATSNGSTQPAGLTGYTMPNDLRGTGYIRICASTATLSSPDAVAAGPADPACAESAAFTTPTVDTQPTLQLALTDLLVSGADTAQLSISVKLGSNRSGLDVFRRLFYRLSGGVWIASNATRTGSNGGVQSFTFSYSVPEDQRGTGSVAVCAAAAITPTGAMLETATAGPGDPVCAVSASFTTMTASPPIALTLTAPATSSALGQPAAWSFTAAAASGAVAGPIYLDFTLPANWSFTSATVAGQPLICPPAATGMPVRCALVASGTQLTTTVKVGTVTLTPGAGSGGQSGVLVARASTLATAPGAAFTCTNGDSACKSASATPQYVDLRADTPVPALNNLPASGGSKTLTCSNSGTRVTPASAFCRIEVLYTDTSTQSEPPVGQPNWTDASGELSVCFSTPPSSGNCLLTLDSVKTVRSIVLRAGMDPAAVASAPDNDTSNNAQTIYDNSPPPPPTVDVSALPVTGNLGTPYSGSFACSGSTRLQNFTCELAATTPLPAGLRVITPCDTTTTGNPATLTFVCTVSGTPTATTASPGQRLTINATSSNATATTVPANLTLNITAGPQACPAIPARAEQYDQMTDAPRVITIMGLNPGQMRYIKLVAGPWWSTEAEYQKYGYLGGANLIIPRITTGWTGQWALSRCPGDVTSSNVVKSATVSFSFHWYARSIGLPVLPAASQNDASGLPGLAVPESQGGQSWYLNFRTDACFYSTPDTCRASYQIF